ncbi:MAG: phosphoadenylyl-sulfate reductase [Gluconobacter potus]|uniref:Adenosine 5'-phosphosulfate reductase n=1 Tax=Gluconobacter potus TaxID=2724927 RepID=A0A149QTG6_9PROT|nr:MULTISPECIES: phosphoadenylyl-sulfate reductase [Gluconobacter]KXV00615.1 phosphoadenosine phosphosulfate reductase [Gluconobacter potus]MBF0863891.1 phosphoadenylyl-sulfate reductase [Gluconobacter sp. R71656]MBF0866698.1 phosphoadenylyl-sulfate reductase [Gluconobacter sp. R75628]MBF0872174.1 phosphoadenylyl-sulfate reductase [Gluconobacter sp. R75629]MBF0881140.1 phosphoadenylyl-sulfate reductase [Gluconobacter potus]
MPLSRTELDHLRQIPEDRVLGETLDLLRGRVAVISSFGAESAVLLDLVAQADPSVPVFFLDTKRHFPETLEYRDRLSRRLGLSDVRTLSPTPKALHDRDPQDQLADFDPDACCALRKVEPLDLVLPDFDVWITGRKRSQSATRAALPLVDPQPDGSVKLNPLAGWGPEKIEAQMQRRDLPRHPLVAKGYTSIGCAPCTRAVKDGEDGRAGRWAGLAKTECGIHRPA